MPGPTGILLGRTHQAVVHRSGCLGRITAGAPPSRIAEEHPEVQFLTASPDGQHLAYWLRKDECFHLASAAGQEFRKRRINTGRAMAHDIRFAPSSDALACIDDYDGGHRLHLFDPGAKSVSEFGPSCHPIGFDAGLQRFVRTRFSAEGPQLPVVDRNGSVRNRIYWHLDGWISLAIHASEPSTSVADCVPSAALEVLGGDGSKHLSYAPPPGTHTVAAALTQANLCLLECSGAGGEFRFRDLPIVNRQ